MVDVELDNILNGGGVDGIIKPDVGDLETPEISDTPTEGTPTNIELIYYMNIDEDTCGSSHDTNGKLISQRIYQTDPDNKNRFICYCDIPCYPTGLFLHLKISGPIRPTNTSKVSITEASQIYYYPYTGLLKIYDEKKTTEVSSYCFVQFCGGSCLPKTYCADSRKIFGFHDFQLKTAEGDLISKGYYCQNDQIVGGYNRTSLNITDTAALTPGSNTTSDRIVLSEGLTIADINSITVSGISSPNIAFDDYELLEDINAISVKFRFTGSGTNTVVLNFTYNVKLECKNKPIENLQNLQQLIFIDPNLGVFTPRQITETQSLDELQLYPVYKVSDDEMSQHQAVYCLNSSSVMGDFDFLSPTALFYQKKLKLNRTLTLGYGYTSNAPYTKLENGVLTPVSTPVSDRVPYQNTDDLVSVPFSPTKISRFGLQDKGLNSFIEDCPVKLKTENKFLMEEDDKPIFANNLLTHTTTSYSKDNPKYGVLDHLSPLTAKGFTTLLDQFHFMCQDQVYRIPLGGNAAVLKLGSIIKSVRASNIASRIGTYAGDSEETSVLPFIGGCFTYNGTNENDYGVSNPKTPSIDIVTEEYNEKKILFEGSSSAICFLREQEDIDLHEKTIVGKYSIPGQKYISLEDSVFYRYPTIRNNNNTLSSLATSSGFLYYNPSSNSGYGCPPLEIRLYTCEPEGLQRSINPFTTKTFPYNIYDDDDPNPAYPVGSNQSLMNDYHDLDDSDYGIPTEKNLELFTHTSDGNGQDYKIDRISISQDRSADNFAVVYKQRYHVGGEKDAVSGIYILIGFMNSGYKVNLNFNLNTEYLALSYMIPDQSGFMTHTNRREINEETYPNDYYERCLKFEYNGLFYKSDANGNWDYLRSCSNTATFPTLEDLQKIDFPTRASSIPYNGIPLLPVRRGGKTLSQNDSFFGTERFFNQQSSNSWNNNSYGLDFYVQLFNQKDYAPYNFIVLTWPKEPVEEE